MLNQFTQADTNLRETTAHSFGSSSKCKFEGRFGPKKRHQCWPRHRRTRWSPRWAPRWRHCVRWPLGTSSCCRQCWAAASSWGQMLRLSAKKILKTPQNNTNWSNRPEAYEWCWCHRMWGLGCRRRTRAVPIPTSRKSMILPFLIVLALKKNDF